MIIVNGDRIEDSKIKINLDEGFNFGYGVFETILVKEKPVFLKEHLKRLNKALKTINIDKVITEDEVYKNSGQLDCKNCALKLSVSNKNVIYSTRNISYKEEDYSKGFSVKISEMKRNPYAHNVYLKSFNYMDNIIERNIALSEGYNEVLFLNTDNYLAEGSVSNVFYIKEDKLYTPSIDCGILDGIIRAWVIQNMDVIEGKFTMKDIMECDGVFITNSLMGIMKVSRINNTPIKNNKMITNIQTMYNDYINQV